jgi:hypothetical protein
MKSPPYLGGSEGLNQKTSNNIIAQVPGDCQIQHTENLDTFEVLAEKCELIKEILGGSADFLSEEEVEKWLSYPLQKLQQAAKTAKVLNKTTVWSPIVRKRIPKGFSPIANRFVAEQYGRHIITEFCAMNNKRNDFTVNLLKLYFALLGIYSHNTLRLKHSKKVYKNGENPTPLPLIVFTNEKIASRTGVSVRSVQRYLRVLEGLGLIFKTRQGFNIKKGESCDSTPAEYVLLIKFEVQYEYFVNGGFFQMGRIRLSSVTLTIIINNIKTNILINIHYISETEFLGQAELMTLEQYNQLREIREEKLIRKSHEDWLKFGKELYLKERRTCKCNTKDKERVKFREVGGIIKKFRVKKHFCLVHKWFSGRKSNPGSGKWAKWNSLSREIEKGRLKLNEIESKNDKYGVMSVKIKEMLRYMPDPLGTSPQMIKYICKDFFDEGWNEWDIMEALEHKPDGSRYGHIFNGKFVPYTNDTVKHLAKWMTARLKFWRINESTKGIPLETESQISRKLREKEKAARQAQFLAKVDDMWEEYSVHKNHEGWTSKATGRKLAPKYSKLCPECCKMLGKVPETKKTLTLWWALPENYYHKSDLQFSFEELRAAGIEDEREIILKQKERKQKKIVIDMMVTAKAVNALLHENKTIPWEKLGEFQLGHEHDSILCPVCRNQMAQTIQTEIRRISELI